MTGVVGRPPPQACPAGGTQGYLQGVWGSIVAVGYGYNSTGDKLPLLYQYNGSGWTNVSLTLPSGWASYGVLHGVWGSSASDVYAVGDGINQVDLPLLYHYDGSGWTASSSSLPSG